jgi:hypothetical protein
MRASAALLLAAMILAIPAVQCAAQGTVVQLPTYSFTGVSTTVNVPDGGSAYLGGINRASDGSSAFGAPVLGKLPFVGRGFRNQSIGSDRSASSFRVTATIHDFEAMDEALLNSASSSLSSASPQRRLADTPAAIAGRTLQPRTPNLAGNWQAKPAAPGAAKTLNASDERARRASREQTREEEAENLFARGQKAEADGKPGLAKSYYQMVSRRSQGALKHQALARLEELGAGQAKIASRE